MKRDFQSKLHFTRHAAIVDNIERLMLDQFLALLAEVASVKDDTREMKARLAAIEASISSLRRDNGDFATSNGAAPRHPDRSKL